MKFEDCKIGQTVKANNGGKDLYVYTSIERHYKGKIINIDEEREMIAVEHISSNQRIGINNEYGFWVEPEHFDLMFNSCADKQIENFKCYREDNKIIVTYKDKVLATAKCNPKDEFDEEFGIALALTRALKKMKTTRETVITESVEDSV